MALMVPHKAPQYETPGRPKKMGEYIANLSLEGVRATALYQGATSEAV
jgi:hypothetical protein